MESPLNNDHPEVDARDRIALPMPDGCSIGQGRPLRSRPPDSGMPKFAESTKNDAPQIDNAILKALQKDAI
jgi:hypothetical protein